MYVQIPATALGVGIIGSVISRSGLPGYHGRFYVPQPTPRLGGRLSGLRCRRGRLCHGSLRCAVGDVRDRSGRGQSGSGNSPNRILGRRPAPDRCKPSSVTRCYLAGTGCLVLRGPARCALGSEHLCRDRLAGVKVIWGPALLPDGYRL